MRHCAFHRDLRIASTGSGLEVEAERCGSSLYDAKWLLEYVD